MGRGCQGGRRISSAEGPRPRLAERAVRGQVGGPPTALEHGKRRWRGRLAGSALLRGRWLVEGPASLCEMDGVQRAGPEASVEAAWRLLGRGGVGLHLCTAIRGGHTQGGGQAGQGACWVRAGRGQWRLRVKRAAVWHGGAALAEGHWLAPLMIPAKRRLCPAGDHQVPRRVARRAGFPPSCMLGTEKLLQSARSARPARTKG